MNLIYRGKKVNLHTHTWYCDGSDKTEEIVKAAILKNFQILGFSGHEHTNYDESYCMSLADTEKYREEIIELKEKYRDKIKILMGVERDYYGEGSDYPYDFVIGSVHAVYKDGEYLYVDKDAKTFEDAVNNHFAGDYLAFAESYYELVGRVVDKTNADIVGHFDLITKFNEGMRYFDEGSLRYRKAVFKALDRLENKGAAFEINTGAMAKGYRSTQYPADFILEELKEKGCEVLLSSDCHNKEKLDFAFDEMLKKIK